jgi:hypothetical protein
VNIRNRLEKLEAAGGVGRHGGDVHRMTDDELLAELPAWARERIERKRAAFDEDGLVRELHKVLEEGGRISGFDAPAAEQVDAFLNSFLAPRERQ